MWYEIIKKIKYIFFCCLSRLVSTQKSGFQQIKNVENVKTVYPAWLAVVKLGSERVIESKATLTRQQLNFRLLKNLTAHHFVHMGTVQYFRSVHTEL